jgi:hypothetical protein
MAEQLKKAIEAIENSKEELEVLNPQEGDAVEGGLLADTKCKGAFSCSGTYNSN